MSCPGQTAGDMQEGGVENIKLPAYGLTLSAVTMLPASEALGSKAIIRGTRTIRHYP